jgi:acyl dehydratase
MAVREIDFAELPNMAGREIGVTDWHEVTQEAVNAFADATLDHQWIHVDRARAEKESPYGTTIAHGYFTLSLIPHFTSQLWRVAGAKMGVNYGLNKLRFPSPVPVGSKIRARVQLDEVTEVKGGVQAQSTVTIEVEGSDKPCCVAQTLSRYYV